MNKSDDIKCELYTIMLKNNETYEESTRLLDDFENCFSDEIEQLNKTYLNEITDINKNLKNLKNIIQKKEEELIKRRKNRETINASLKYLILIRQSINPLFIKKWRLNKTTIENENYFELAKKTDILKRKNLIDRNDGIKYALCVMNDICKDTPKDICEFYIKLNDKFHPKPYPKSIIIDAITKLRDMLDDDGCTISLCNDIGITKKMLSGLMIEINNLYK